MAVTYEDVKKARAEAMAAIDGMFVDPNVAKTYGAVNAITDHRPPAEVVLVHLMALQTAIDPFGHPEAFAASCVLRQGMSPAGYYTLRELARALGFELKPIN